jgi:hypothetical protein
LTIPSPKSDFTPSGLGPKHHVHQNHHPRTYDPTTGAVTGADTSVTLKGVITRINARESEGLYQTSDLQVVIGNSELRTYYPTEADRIQYTQAGTTREAKILNVTSYRGR